MVGRVWIWPWGLPLLVARQIPGYLEFGDYFVRAYLLVYSLIYSSQPPVPVQLLATRLLLADPFPFPFQPWVLQACSYNELAGRPILISPTSYKAAGHIVHA